MTNEEREKIVSTIKGKLTEIISISDSADTRIIRTSDKQYVLEKYSDEYELLLRNLSFFENNLDLDLNNLFAILHDLQLAPNDSIVTQYELYLNRISNISNLIAEIEVELVMITNKNSGYGINDFRRTFDGNFVLKSYADYYEYLLDFKSKIAYELKTGIPSFIKIPELSEIVTYYVNTQEKNETKTIENMSLEEIIDRMNEISKKHADVVFGIMDAPDSPLVSASNENKIYQCDLHEYEALLQRYNKLQYSVPLSDDEKLAIAIEIEDIKKRIDEIEQKYIDFLTSPLDTPEVDSATASNGTEVYSEDLAEYENLLKRQNELKIYDNILDDPEDEEERLFHNQALVNVFANITARLNANNANPNDNVLEAINPIPAPPVAPINGSAPSVLDDEQPHKVTRAEKIKGAKKKAFWILIGLIAELYLLPVAIIPTIIAIPIGLKYGKKIKKFVRNLIEKGLNKVLDFEEGINNALIGTDEDEEEILGDEVPEDDRGMGL